MGAQSLGTSDMGTRWMLSPHSRTAPALRASTGTPSRAEARFGESRLVGACCERGAPFHTFPLDTPAANKFAAIVVFPRSGPNRPALRAASVVMPPSLRMRTAWNAERKRRTREPVGARFVVVCSPRSRDPWFPLVSLSTVDAPGNGVRRSAPGAVLRPGVPEGSPRLQCHPAAGAWLSLAEHLVRDQGVAGSNPAAPTRPVPRDGFRAPRRPRRSAASDASVHSAPSHQGSDASRSHSAMGQTCIFRRACRACPVPASALFHALAS